MPLHAASFLWKWLRHKLERQGGAVWPAPCPASVVLKALCRREAPSVVSPEMLAAHVAQRVTFFKMTTPCSTFVCLFLVYRDISFSQSPAGASLCFYGEAANSSFLAQHP